MSNIQILNDTMRSIIPLTRPQDQMVMTSGIASLEPEVVAKIWQKVRDYNEFPEDDDPWGEHDFGAFVIDNERVFWKIDYYDPNLEFGSEDPADDRKTARVLTVMLAEEY